MEIIFKLKKTYNKFLISSSLLLAMAYLVVMFTKKDNDFFDEMFYVLISLSLITTAILELKQYNNLIIRIDDNYVKIKWLKTFKQSQINIDVIKEINITKGELKIQNQEGLINKFNIIDFKNEQRKRLLTFFKSNFDNVTIN